jgi:hypothetical protein
MRPGFVAFALAALIGASTASAECLKANQNGEVAEGILSLGTFEDANIRRKPISSPCRLPFA